MEEFNSNNNFYQGNTDEYKDVEQISFIKRVIGIIFSPAETMKVLIAKPRILFPIILMIITTPAFYFLRFDLFKDYTKQIIEASLANNPQITPETIQKAMPLYINLGLYGSPFGELLTWLVFAALLFGIMKLFKGEGNFKQYLSIVGYSYIIYFLYILLCTVVSYFSGSLLLNASATNITNLFVPDMKGSYVYGLLRGLDFFAIWRFIVIGIGTALVSKVSKAKVYSVISLIFIAVVLYGAMSLKFT